MSDFNPFQYALALIMPSKVKMVPPTCRIVPMPYSLNPFKQNRATGRKRR